MTETARLADVVLPAASFAEREGTVTSTDSRGSALPQGHRAIGESRPTGRSSVTSAAHGDSKEFEYSSAAEIMDEIARLTPTTAASPMIG